MDIIKAIGEEFSLFDFEMIDAKINLTLELGRSCDIGCDFYGNNMFESADYDLDLSKIVKNLIIFLPFLREVKVLDDDSKFTIDDLITLKKVVTILTKVKYFNPQKYNLTNAMEHHNIMVNCQNTLGVLIEMLKTKNNIYNFDLDRINFLVFSNGFGNIDDYIKLIENGFSLAFNRYHYDEGINSSFFNGATPIISGRECYELYQLKLERVFRKLQPFRNVNRIPYLNQKEGDVLFQVNMLNNGISSMKDVIDYLHWVYSLSLVNTLGMKVVFTNLRNDISLDDVNVQDSREIFIDDALMEEFDEYFGARREIISSSGYTLTNYHFYVEEGYRPMKIYLKRYLNKKEFEEKWNTFSSKKYIDLSMDLKGNVYTDSTQNKKLVLK